MNPQSLKRALALIKSANKTLGEMLLVVPLTDYNDAYRRACTKLSFALTEVEDALLRKDESEAKR